MPGPDADLALLPDGGPDALVAAGDGSRPAKAGWGLGFWLAAAWLAVLFVALVATPWLPVDDPNQTSGDYLAGPGGGALFGTDELGRDMLARILWGGRVSLAIGVAALVAGLLIGGAIGITAGFFGGAYERIVMAVMDLMLSFPSLILAIALIAALSEPGTQEGSFPKLVVVLTILAVPALARITRANTLVYSRREFVTAARSLGARNGRILVREILPNVLPSMLSFAFLALAILVIAEGALAFLGLSVEAPTVTWGKLIELGRRRLDSAAYLTLVPCGFLFVTLLSLNFVGDRLQSRFAVREGQV